MCFRWQQKCSEITEHKKWWFLTDLLLPMITILASLRTEDVFPVVASLPPKNDVCDPELRYDFHDVSVY